MGNRASIDGLILSIQRFESDVKEGAASIVADFAHDGERVMEQVIVEAETKTGYARVADDDNPGNSPGRVDTGLMINQVSSEWEQDGDTYIGRFGWTKETEDYFLYQENGTEHIEAMNALGSAAVQGRERAIKRISNIARDARK